MNHVDSNTITKILLHVKQYAHPWVEDFISIPHSATGEYRGELSAPLTSKLIKIVSQPVSNQSYLDLFEIRFVSLASLLKETSNSVPKTNA